jgi:hypothetical protein
MVLEDANSSPPSSDDDLYGGSNPEYLESRPSGYIRVNDTEPAIYVNGANLPKPILMTSNHKVAQAYEKAIHDLVQASMKVLQRPMTQEEADAIAFHYAAGMRISSYGMPLGAVAGALQFRRGMRTFRFPFRTPFKAGSRFSPDQFGPLRDAQARAAWQSLRLGAYLAVGAYLGRYFGISYALYSVMSAHHKDPRLKEYREAAQKRGQEMRQRRGEAANKQRGTMEETERATQKGESLEMWRMRKQAEVEEAMKRQASGADSGRVIDDMSPTGGAYEEEMRMQSDAFVRDDWQTPQSENSKQPWQDSTSFSGAATTSPTNTPPATSKPQRPANSSSPQSSSTSKQSGSAWDRLRRDAMSRGSQPGSSASSQSSSARSNIRSSPQSDSDSFSFSQGYEDKQLARSEAQKEFDARIEREREGKDFDDSRGGGGKKW